MQSVRRHTLGNLGRKAADALPVIDAMPIYETNRDLIEKAIGNIKEGN